LSIYYISVYDPGFIFGPSANDIIAAILRA